MRALVAGDGQGGRLRAEPAGGADHVDTARGIALRLIAP